MEHLDIAPYWSTEDTYFVAPAVKSGKALVASDADRLKQYASLHGQGQVSTSVYKSMLTIARLKKGSHTDAAGQTIKSWDVRGDLIADEITNLTDYLKKDYAAGVMDEAGVHQVLSDVQSSVDEVRGYSYLRRNENKKRGNQIVQRITDSFDKAVYTLQAYSPLEQVAVAAQTGTDAISSFPIPTYDRHRLLDYADVEYVHGDANIIARLGKVSLDQRVSEDKPRTVSLDVIQPQTISAYNKEMIEAERKNLGMFVNEFGNVQSGHIELIGAGPSTAIPYNYAPKPFTGNNPTSVLSTEEWDARFNPKKSKQTLWQRVRSKLERDTVSVEENDRRRDARVLEKNPNVSLVPAIVPKPKKIHRSKMPLALGSVALVASTYIGIMTKKTFFPSESSAPSSTVIEASSDYEDSTNSLAIVGDR